MDDNNIIILDRVKFQELLDKHAFTFYEIAQTGLWQIDEEGYLLDENYETMRIKYPHHMNNYKKFTDELVKTGWRNKDLKRCVGNFTTVLGNKINILECKLGEMCGLAIN